MDIKSFFERRVDNVLGVLIILNILHQIISSMAFMGLPCPKNNTGILPVLLIWEVILSKSFKFILQLNKGKAAHDFKSRSTFWNSNFFIDWNYENPYLFDDSLYAILSLRGGQPNKIHPWSQRVPIFIGSRPRYSSC